MASAPASDLLLPDLIATYLARCAIEGKSPRTIAAYRETLTRFQHCLHEDGAPLDPDRFRPDHEIAYLARFADHRPATATSARCAASGTLRAAGYTANDPFRGLDPSCFPSRGSRVRPPSPAPLFSMEYREGPGVSVARAQELSTICFPSRPMEPPRGLTTLSNRAIDTRGIEW